MSCLKCVEDVKEILGGGVFFLRRCSGVGGTGGFAPGVADRPKERTVKQVILIKRRLGVF
jgi:hypothetical protein